MLAEPFRWAELACKLVAACRGSSAEEGERGREREREGLGFLGFGTHEQVCNHYPAVSFSQPTLQACASPNATSYEVTHFSFWAAQADAFEGPVWLSEVLEKPQLVP